MPTVVVEKEKPYTAEGVAAWLMENPQRLSNVLAQLPDIEDTLRAVKGVSSRLQAELCKEQRGWKETRPVVMPWETIPAPERPPADAVETVPMQDESFQAVAFKDTMHAMPKGLTRHQRRKWLRDNGHRNGQ